MTFDKEMMEKFSGLKEQAHAIAKEKGWWDDGVEMRPAEDQWNNFHAEVSEAWEEYRTGRPLNDVRLMAGDVCVSVLSPAELSRDLDGDEATCKPEGFWVEIADLLIRLADSAEANGWKLDLSVSYVGNSPPRMLIAFLHHELARPFIGFTGEEYAMSRVVRTCMACAANAGVYLWDVIRLKMNYNRTRPYRHGNKMA